MILMKKVLISSVLMLAALPAFAAVASYDITTTWYEPDTQPNNSIFEGSFSYDATTHAITGLTGQLSESMTGTNPSNMTWVALNYQLVSWYSASLGGTFAAVFSKNSTATFMGNTWMPADGVDVGGVFAGGPAMKNYASSIQNSYALIFVPNDPLATLSAQQLSMVAYADCAPGGMMGAVCMTGTSNAAYGSPGTMGGYPFSQVITAAVTTPVPEADIYAMMGLGLGLLVMMQPRRRQRV